MSDAPELRRVSDLNLVWRPQDGLERLWPAWRPHVGMQGPWPGEDLIGALLLQFCHGLWIEDFASFKALQGPALFLANHQVAVESILFGCVATPWLSAPLHAIAKQEHASSWVGRLFERCYAWPGVRNPDAVFFQPYGDSQATLDLSGRLREILPQRRCGLLIHADATRVLSCLDPVHRMSGVFLELAIACDAPVAPVKFRGGLPVEPLEAFHDFPIGFGAQDFLIGRPISAAELSAAPYGRRREMVMERINSLGGALEAERPSPPDRAFKADVRSYMRRSGVTYLELAVIWAALRRLPAPTPSIEAVMRGIDERNFETRATPKGIWEAETIQWLTEGRAPVKLRPV
jgi:1-acyl-sn-glycerol-3-phosphate acyltransferase